MFKWIGKAAKWVWKNRDKIEFIIDILDGDNDNPEDKRVALKLETRIAKKKAAQQAETDFYA